MLNTRNLAFLLTISILVIGLPSRYISAQTQTSRPRMIRISAGILGGMVHHIEPPQYPEDALNSGIQGDVILQVEIDESGKVIFATPVAGNALLTAASVEALSQSSFRPFLLNGEAIRVESEIGFHFTIHGHGTKATGKAESVFSLPSQPEFRTGTVTDKGVLVLSPKRISGEMPQLPPELADKTGSIYLKITIGKDGRVQDVSVIGGDSSFTDFVVAAVKKYIYEPQTIDGKPSAVTIQAVYHFEAAH